MRHCHEAVDYAVVILWVHKDLPNDWKVGRWSGVEVENHPA